MDEDKTELWLKASPSNRYNLPDTCPFCGEKLKATNVYVGIFPYIHTDFTLVCWGNAEHKFNFCFPYNKVMVAGYTVYDDADYTRYVTDYVCPFHGVKLQPIRLYGNIVFNDGTKKMQLRCPVCNYSERKTLKKIS